MFVMVFIDVMHMNFKEIVLQLHFLNIAFSINKINILHDIKNYF